MKYDAAFFHMIKLRGEELFPLDPPFKWYFVETGAGIVYGKGEISYEWWLSWIRKDFVTEEIFTCTQEYTKDRRTKVETTATQEQLEKMSGDDIVSLLFSHFTFMDKGNACEAASNLS